LDFEVERFKKKIHKKMPTAEARHNNTGFFITLVLVNAIYKCFPIDTKKPLQVVRAKKIFP
jgi:hypothetical protein